MARDGDVLVVCEVKTRSSTALGHPLEAVTARKAARLRRLAAAWITERQVHPPDVRIDLVGVLRPAARRRRGRARAGGGLSAAGPHPGRGAGGRRRPPGRGRGRPRGRRAVVQPGRAAGRVADRVARPGARGDGQQRAALAGHQAGHRQPVAGAACRSAARASTSRSPRRSSRPRSVVPQHAVRRRGAARRARPGRAGPAGARRAAGRGGGRPGGGGGGGRPGGQRGRGGAGARACGSPGCAPWPGWSPGPAATSCPTSSWPRTPRPPADAGRPTTRRTGRTWPTCSARRTARYLLEVAAAGGHHLLMSGRPGAGKTMLAERLPGLLPPLDRARRARGDRGALGRGLAARRRRPAGRRARRSRRRTTPRRSRRSSAAARPRSGPGAASLAHRGVLFMDEAPEFAPAVLDALREPLESGEITRRPAGRPGAASRPGSSWCSPPTRARAGWRPPRRGRRRLHLHADGPAALPRPAVRSAARPGRPADRDARGHPGRPARRRRARRRPPPWSPSGSPRRGSGWRPGWPARRGGSTPRCRATCCGGCWRLPWEVVAEAERLLDRGVAHGPGRRPGGAGRLDAGRPGRVATCPDAGDVRRGPGLPRAWRGGRRDGRRSREAERAGPGRADPAGRAGRRRGSAARWPGSARAEVLDRVRSARAGERRAARRTTGSGCPRWRADAGPRGRGPAPGSSCPATTSGPPRSTTWATGRRIALWVAGDGHLADAAPAERSRSSGPGPARRTASTWPASSRPGSATAAGRSCPAAPTASTRPRTAARWPSTAPTVAVLACGVDVRLPARRTTGCSARSGRRGVVVSELPPGSRPDPAPVPRPQPGHRRAGPRHGRGRGGDPQRGAEHGRAGRRAVPAGDGRPRPGHLGRVGRLPRADPGSRRRAGHRRGRRARPGR